MNAASIGRRVALLRRQAGMSQSELAKRMKTTQAAVSKIESGRNLPTLLWLDRFARATRRPFDLSFGAPNEAPTRSELRGRVRALLGDEPFDPWERSPTPAEAKSLESDGLTRDRFRRSKTTARARR